MARHEGDGLAGRIFCCGRQGPWRGRVAFPRLRVLRRLRCFASGSRDVLELPSQEDAASLQSDQRPTAGGHQRGSLTRSTGSSTSTPPKVKQRRALSSLSSSPPQLRGGQSHAGIGGEGSAERRGETAPDGLTAPPMINLIPPTPSNVVDDGRFFETTSEVGSTTQSSVSKRAAGPGSPKNRHASSCKTSQGPEIRSSRSTCRDDVGLVEGDASVISPDNPAKPDTHLLEELLEADSENVPLQLGFNPSWNLENNVDSGAESNASSHVNLIRNYPLAQQDTRENDLNTKETGSKDPTKTNLRLKPLNTNPDSKPHTKRSAMRSCSLGDVKTVVGDLQSLGLSMDTGAEGGVSPWQRRITMASYIPSSLDQGENLKDKVDTEEQRGKSLEEMDTLEVCKWFKSLGLQRSVPFIKEAKLQGHQLTAINFDTLDQLQLTTTEEKESLLSAIYKELHPTDTRSQNIDQLLETIGPHDVERFTAALACLSTSPAPEPSEWIDRPSHREDKDLEEKTIRKSNLVTLSVKAFERKLRLRVPRDSTAADVIEACRKILGLKDDVSLLTLNTVAGTPGKVLKELQVDEQMGELKLLGRKEFKLQLCKKNGNDFNGLDKKVGAQVERGSAPPDPAPEPGVVPTSPQGDLQSGHRKEAETEEIEIAELQKRFFALHQEAVGLFTEHTLLTNPAYDPNDSEPQEQLIQHLKLAQQVLDNHRYEITAYDAAVVLSYSDIFCPSLMDEYWPWSQGFSSTGKNLLELLKLDYRMLKERTCTFHRRQPRAAWNSLHEFQRPQANSNWQSVTLSQLIAPHSTAVLLRVQLTARPEGYGFTVKWSADFGLQIETAENTGLQPNDRLVAVNGVCVLSVLEDELGSYLTTPTAQILALRNPAPSNPGSLNRGETDDVPKPDWVLE